MVSGLVVLMRTILVQGLVTATAGAAFVTLSAVGAAQAATLVVPNSLSATEGNFTDTLIPAPFRYQQVYKNSDFTSLSGSQPLKITQIAFRPDAKVGSAFSFTLSDIQLDLSTTKAEPDNLSTTFANNVGADDTVVVNRGPLSLSSAYTGPAAGPKNFDIIFNFTNPFIYNPSAGNLLLDIRKFSSSPTTFFDGAFAPGDSVSVVFAPVDVNAAAANASNTFGVVTQFTVTPVPEPSETLGILALGAFGGGSLLKRKLKNRKVASRVSPIDTIPNT